MKEIQKVMITVLLVISCMINLAAQAEGHFPGQNGAETFAVVNTIDNTIGEVAYA